MGGTVFCYVENYYETVSVIFSYKQHLNVVYNQKRFWETFLPTDIKLMKKAINMLEQMMLSNPDNIMKSYPFQLSGGMRQRVGIAMAMTFSPKLLIADEPTSALDVTTQSQIIRNMLELREKFNTGIIMVTHNLAIAAYISDKIIVMKDGKIVEQGSRDNIINNPKDEYTKELLNSVSNWEEKLYV